MVQTKIDAAINKLKVLRAIETLEIHAPITLNFNEQVRRERMIEELSDLILILNELGLDIMNEPIQEKININQTNGSTINKQPTGRT